MNSHIIGRDGTVTFIHANKAYTVGVSHANYQRILTAIKGRKYTKAVELMDVAQAIRSIGHGIAVEDGNVTLNGNVVGNVVVDRIQSFIKQGLPHKPLARFAENLQANPSNRSVTELYKFLENRGFPITEDGCFIAYKGIRQDWMDIYSGTFDNHIGKTVSVPRNTVDDNCNNTCSKGLHVGSYRYASGYAGSGGRVVLVKVNPADCVSVPVDENAEKLRVWQYKVVGEAPAQMIEDELRDESGLQPVAPSNTDFDDKSEDDDFGFGFDDDEDDQF